MQVTIDWSTVVAMIAATVAVIAAIISGRQAAHARRQADAAHGEVEPTFHLVFESRYPGARIINFDFVANNYSRHALRITSLYLSVPKGMLIFLDGNSTRAIVGGVLQRGVLMQSVSIFETLDGIAPSGSASTRFEKALAVAFEEDKPRASHAVELAYQVTYLLLDGKGTVRVFEGKDRFPYEPSQLDEEKLLQGDAR